MIAIIDAARKRHNAAVADAMTALDELSVLVDLPDIARLEKQYCDAMESVNSAVDHAISDAGDSIPQQKESWAGTRALGIWPDIDLDYKLESDALYNAGFEYVGLVGDEATRVGVIRELDRYKNIGIVGIGAHGDANGIYLADGLARPRWWVEALSGRGVRLVVLASCESDAVGDSLIDAKFSAVISTQRQIDDDQSAAFVSALYANLARDEAIDVAVRNAKLVVNRETWEMIRFRQG